MKLNDESDKIVASTDDITQFRIVDDPREYLRIIPKNGTLDVIVCDGVTLSEAARQFIIAVNNMMTLPMQPKSSPAGYEVILFCAFRYALGRRTYVVDYVTKAIHAYWPDMQESDKSIFANEIIEHYERYGNLGHDIDKEQWMSIVDRYNSEKFTQSNENGA
ncbi:MAG: hypothetical protein ACK5GV_01100 [Bacteroidota bacterium]|jgi:hypothetical protein